MSACGPHGAAGDRPDVREQAAGVPGWEGSYQRWRAVELDAAVAGGLGPGELAGVPFDEGFGFRRDVEVLRSEERRVGKSVSVRVDLGGRRIIKKTNKELTHITTD